VIAIVDYGVGNLRSAAKGFERACAEEELDLEVRVTGEARAIERASAVVLPGVGAFGACMASLDGAGLSDVVRDAAGSGRPFLGICVGMQLLFEESEEFGRVAGLGILPGRVVRFRSTDVKIPHMGWNELRLRTPTPMLEGIPEGTFYYFVHSYYAAPAEPSLVAASAKYGEEEFAAAVGRASLFATQFHPEKSQNAGVRLLRNFVRGLSAPASVASVA
jgi:glutamine amidotransferase